MSLGPKLAATLRRGAHRLGLDVRQASPAGSVKLRRREVLRAEPVDAVIDVGANRGQYGTELRDWGYSGRILSLEPLRSAYVSLRDVATSDDRWDVFQLALGDFSGERTINVSENLLSSSFREMHPAHLDAAPESRYVGRETVRMETLDRFAGVHLEEARGLYLKADVQGFELEVLEHGLETLERVLGLELEVSLIPLYRGAPTASEALSKLRAWGLTPTAIEPAWVAESGEVVQLDVVLERRLPSPR